MSLIDLLFLPIPGGLVTLAVLRYAASFAALTLAERYRRDDEPARATITLLCAVWLWLGGLSLHSTPNTPNLYGGMLYLLLTMQFTYGVLRQAKEAHRHDRN